MTYVGLSCRNASSPGLSRGPGWSGCEISHFSGSCIHVWWHAIVVEECFQLLPLIFVVRAWETHQHTGVSAGQLIRILSSQRLLSGISRSR